MTGFTRISIVVNSGQWNELKFDKSTGVERGTEWGRRILMGEKDKADFIFIDHHRHLITNRVHRMTDVDLLRQVADLIGYKQEDAKP